MDGKLYSGLFFRRYAKFRNILILSVIIILLYRITRFPITPSFRDGNSYHDYVDMKITGSHVANNVTMEVVVIVTGIAYTEQAKTLIKSILMFSSVKINFFIFTDDAARVEIEKETTKIASFIDAPFSATFYDIDISYKQALEPYKVDPEKFANFGAKSAMLKLVLPLVLSYIKRVLIIDTDVVVLGDLKLLWDEFKHFGKGHILGAGPEGYTYHKKTNGQPFYGKNGANFGISLMDIAKCNKVSFVKKIVDYFNRKSNLVLSHHDQGFLNLYFHDNPQRLYDIPCHLVFHGDIDGCSYVDQSLFRNCESANENGVLLLHGTTGRFHDKHDVTETQREHAYEYVLEPGSQPEYLFIMQLFRELRTLDETSRSFWTGSFESFAKHRNSYCNEQICPKCVSSSKMLKILNKTISLMVHN